jgi:RNA polymerase sigma-70 factor, ECF subfamily
MPSRRRAVSWCVSRFLVDYSIRVSSNLAKPIKPAQIQQIMKDPDVNPNEQGQESPGSTAPSLLAQVKARDPRSWQRLVSLYGPLVYSWARRAGLQASDAADIVQEVFRAVATHIAGFERTRGSGSFRAWLATIARNKINDYWRRRAHTPQAQGGSEAQGVLLQLPAEESTDSVEAASDIGGLLSVALELIRSEFEERSWQAFWRVTVEGRLPGDVAAELSMSVNSVYVAKSRILRRLREEFGDLIE